MKTGLCFTTIALFALLTCPAKASVCAGCDDECGQCDYLCSGYVDFACVYHGYCIPQPCDGIDRPPFACICCEQGECAIPGQGCIPCPEAQPYDASNQGYTPAPVAEEASAIAPPGPLKRLPALD